VIVTPTSNSIKLVIAGHRINPNGLQGGGAYWVITVSAGGVRQQCEIGNHAKRHGEDQYA
jgi:hypothetical protein